MNCQIYEGATVSIGTHNYVIEYYFVEWLVNLMLINYYF